MNDWVRPSTLPFPNVWRRIPGFVIQDLPPEMEEAALDHIVKFFLHDEPICKSVGLANDKQSVNEFRSIIREQCFPCNVSVACIEESTNKLVGVNINRVLKATEVKEEIEELEKLLKELKGEPLLKFMNILKQCYMTTDIYKHFGVDLLLDYFALSVDSAYRERGIGKEIVLACVELAKGCGIPLTRSDFTSNYSGRIAKNTGLELLGEVQYDNYLNPDGSKILENISPHVSVKLMAGPVPNYIPPPPGH